jgi:hypothetical protein
VDFVTDVDGPDLRRPSRSRGRCGRVRQHCHLDVLAYVRICHRRDGQCRRGHLGVFWLAPETERWMDTQPLMHWYPPDVPVSGDIDASFRMGWLRLSGAGLVGLFGIRWAG